MNMKGGPASRRRCAAAMPARNRKRKTNSIAPVTEPPPPPRRSVGEEDGTGRRETTGRFLNAVNGYQTSQEKCMTTPVQITRSSSNAFMLPSSACIGNLSSSSKCSICFGLWTDNSSQESPSSVNSKLSLINTSFQRRRRWELSRSKDADMYSVTFTHSVLAARYRTLVWNLIRCTLLRN